MTAHKYNGWTNYATWNIKVWIDNDCHDYGLWYDEALKALDSIPAGKDRLSAGGTNTSSIQHDAALILMKVMETHFDNEFDGQERSTGWITDLMHHTLDEVNWYEIAESIVNDAWERENSDTWIPAKTPATPKSQYEKPRRHDGHRSRKGGAK
jgi:hypothetical protein